MFSSAFFLYRFSLLYCAGAQRCCLTIYWIFSISIHNTSEQSSAREKRLNAFALFHSCVTLYSTHAASRTSIIFQLNLFDSTCLSLSRHSRIQWLCKLHYIIQVNLCHFDARAAAFFYGNAFTLLGILDFVKIFFMDIIQGFFKYTSEIIKLSIFTIKVVSFIYEKIHSKMIHDNFLIAE